MDKRKLHSIVKEAIENVIGSENQVDGLDGLLKTAQEISSYALVLYNNAKLIPKAYDEIRSNLESLGISVESVEYSVTEAYYQMSDDIIPFVMDVNRKSGYYSEEENTPYESSFLEVFDDEYSERIVSGNTVRMLSDSVFDGWSGHFAMRDGKVWFMFEGNGRFEYGEDAKSALGILKDLGLGE